jgi:hypothetical protein
MDTLVRHPAFFLDDRFFFGAAFFLEFFGFTGIRAVFLFIKIY